MFRLTLLSSFKRLTVCDKIEASITRSVSTDTQLCFQVTPYLCGEPLKKKRRLDPSIVRAREERRKKKIEKQIRKLEKHSQQLKPIEECEVPSVLISKEDLKIRQRQRPILTEGNVDDRVRLIKAWALYRYKQAIQDTKTIDRLMQAQSKALEELRLESEELYQEAIQIDPGMLPFQVRGPTVTPSIKDYDSPDGEYTDISKKWG